MINAAGGHEVRLRDLSSGFKRRLLLALALLALFLTLSLSFKVEAGEPYMNASDTIPLPLEIHLKDGAEASKDLPESLSTPPAVEMSQDAVGRLLKMFTEPLQPPKEPVLFLKRASSLPAPRSVTPVKLPFPPPGNDLPPAVVPGSQLEVLAVTPQGDTERAPRLSITFNHPMVALGDLKDAKGGEALGIILEPRPRGSWRWLGTETLIFEPALGEFPRATEYRLTIPAGLKDISGQALSQEKITSFKLPAPSVTFSAPKGSPVDLNPAITICFDQPVDRLGLISKLSLLNEEGKKVELRELTSAEAKAAAERTHTVFKEGSKDEVFWFTPKRALTPATTYKILVDADLKGLEGPRAMSSSYSSLFTTYQPLRLDRVYPQKEDEASPFSPFSLVFNNSLDRASFRPELISFEPPIEGAKFLIYQNSLAVQGVKSGNTKYKALISGELKDVYGQKLGKSINAGFATARAPKALFSTSEAMTILSPGASGTGMTIYSTNIDKLRLAVFRVEPKDWTSYLKYSYEHRSYSVDKDGIKMPGQQLTDSILEVKNVPDRLVCTELDLSKYLVNGRGNLIVSLTDPSEDKESYRERSIFTWMQATALGLDFDVSSEQAIATVSRLSDGKPVPDAEVILGKNTLKTSADGSAVFQLTDDLNTILLAKASGDQAFLPRSLSYYSHEAGWAKTAKEDEIRWFIFDDRGLYKPGETVHLKGYLRKWTRGAKGALATVGEPGQEASWTLKDARGNKLSEGKTELSALGTVDFTVDLPKDTNLGFHPLVLSAPGLKSTTHQINVQEFRRPEFEVVSSVVSAEPHIAGEKAIVKAKASYYAGGSLAGSAVSWLVSSEPASYTPPGLSEYSFGQWTPWWDLGPWWLPPKRAQNTSQRFEAVTSYAGEHQLEMEFGRVSPALPTTVTATASVSDLNRQQRSSSSSLLVHPSAYYVGLKPEKTFVDEKSDFKLKAVVSDIDGNLVPGVTLRLGLYKLEYADVDDSPGLVEKEVARAEYTSGQQAIDASLQASEGGSYRIKAQVVDAKGRPNLTTVSLWKAGGILPSKDKVELESLTLVPDAKEYSPGQAANILVMAPFAEGEGSVVWSRDGLLDRQSFSLKNGSATLSFPITDELVPNLHALVTVVGKSTWGKEERPAVASGKINLSISKRSRDLMISLTPVDAKLDPGSEVELEAEVKDHAGTPVAGAEVTLWMADEAVLGLVDYKLPNLLKAFYSDRPLDFTSFHSRTSVALKSLDLDTIQQTMANSSREHLRGGAGAGVLYMSAPLTAPAPTGMARERAEKSAAIEGASAAQAFTVRKDFSALAVFKGRLATDQKGRTKISLKLPDNLTRYRIFSVAVRGATEFGSGDQLLTARLPLMVKPSLPRFLNFGDKANLPVVLQNQGDKPLAVELVGEAQGVEWLGPRGLKVTVPANDRVEVSFRCEASQVGKAKFRFGAVSGSYTDAAEVELPVYTPATSEAFATYGTLGDSKEALGQQISRPKDAWPQFGGVQLSFSSTALSELSDAFLYLYDYPFECAEQRASRVLSIAALHDVLAAFKAPGLPEESAIKAKVEADLTGLYRMQNTDGGWSFWGGNKRSLPFVSVHVSHAVARAKLAGFKVDDGLVGRIKAYLRLVESNCKGLKYSEDATNSCLAYALYVRDLLGDGDGAKAKKLFHKLTSEAKDVNLEALGWLWPTLAKSAKGSPELLELRRIVLNRATQTVDKAQFSMGYESSEGKQLLLHSSRRTDAILLYALLVDEPNNALNPKLVGGLLAQRKRGRWDSTQENAWVLLALQKYFRTFEKTAPDFVARAWMADSYLGEEAFKGYSIKEASLVVPMASLRRDKTDLVLAKDGPGRLYYRLGLSYAPKDLKVAAQSRGFTLERKFEGVDDARDVSQNASGDWVIKAGAKIKVTLSMVVPERRYHVALVDPLAAGMEALNSKLVGTPPAATGGVSASGAMRYLWWWRWYEHENLRDERVEAFASILYPGVYTYTYTALATTPGEYVLPPTKAEEMYSPEVYGRTASGRMIIE